MIIAPPNPESRQITKMLTDLEVRMKRAEAGLRSAQLKNSSITDGALNIYDADGNLRTVIGRQADGSVTTVTKNNPLPPAVPAAPIVTAALASLIVRHLGETQSGVSWPADLDHLNIYYAPVQNPDDIKSGGSLGTGFPEELPIAPLEYTEYLVWVTAVNSSGKESAKSEPSSGSPNQVVNNDIITNIFNDLNLSAGQVTEAAIAAGAVTETKIAPDSISSPLIKAGAILGVHILADQIDASKLIAQTITSREIKALAIIAGKIDVNAVTAGTIAAGAVTAVKLETNLLITSRFIAGSLTGNRVEIHPLLGLQAYSGGGTIRSFWIDAATGSALLIGEIRTAASGARIIMNPGGSSPDRIQFWPDAAGGSVDFAYIDSFPDGAVDTGITMQASGGSTTRVGTIWLRKAFAAVGIADNGLVANSHFYAEPNFVRCRSATVDLMVDQAVTPLNGPRRVAFIHVNTSGAPVANSGLFYGVATANQYPILYKPEFNLGIIFDGGGYVAIVHNDAGYTRATIEASDFRVGSDSRGKTSIREFGFSALDAITSNPAKKWKRLPPGPALHADGVTQKATGEDSDGDTLFEDSPTTHDDPWFFGPMADSLPPEMVHINPDTGMRSFGMMAALGVLWKGLEELSDKFKELEASKDK